jgi:hypothetical protein
MAFGISHESEGNFISPPRGGVEGVEYRPRGRENRLSELVVALSLGENY